MKEVEYFPYFGKGMNEFMKEYFINVTPTKKFISELPPQLSDLKDFVKTSRFESKKICDPFLEGIFDFDVRSDDVFVCSLPKCGSSWLQTIVWLLTHNLNYDDNQKENRAKQMGDFNEITNIPIAQAIVSKLRANDKCLSQIDAAKIAWNEVFRHLITPRVIKNHYPSFFLPKRIWKSNAKIIYVARNPKDMAVSLYHMIRNFFFVDVTMDDIINGIVKDTITFSPLLDQILSFWRIKHLPNVLFVAYEDVVLNSFESIKEISTFLECKYSDEQLKELTEYISFDSMKQIKSINREADVKRMEELLGNKRPDAKFT